MNRIVLVFVTGICLLLPSIVRGAYSEGEIAAVSKTTFKLKTEKGEVLTFLVTTDLANGRLDRAEFLYKNTFKELRVGQMIQVQFRFEGKTRVATRLRITKQRTIPDPEPPPNRRKGR